MVDPSPASETRSVSTQWVYQMNPSENNNGLFTWWYQMKGCGISNEPNVTSKHPQADGYVSYWHQGNSKNRDTFMLYNKIRSENKYLK